MTGSRIALDTNQAVHVLNDVAPVIAWLDTFDELCLPVTVIGELLYGALNSARATANVAKVDALVGRCQVLRSDVNTCGVYAQLRLDLKSQGRPIPENDLWIAASCVEHNVPLATDDAHFDAITSLQTRRVP